MDTGKEERSPGKGEGQFVLQSQLGALKPTHEVSDDSNAGTQDQAGAIARPQLQSIATTAVSRTDIHIQPEQDGSREAFASTADTPTPSRSNKTYGSIRRIQGLRNSDLGDSNSLKTSSQTVDTTAENESLLGDVFGPSQDVSAFKLLSGHLNQLNFSDAETSQELGEDKDFYREFDNVGNELHEGPDEVHALGQWRAKRKHFIILSSAGKPIYNRHGDDHLISSTIGVIQTIISFFEDSKDQLRYFATTEARFVIMTRGPLHLVAVSKLNESEGQLRSQLEALYMQILSTLTLPTLNTLFANRPSTDLRRPLQGTEVLLSALADSFTRGSPTSLLTAVECLRIKKSARLAINELLLRHRTSKLLYGLIVAGGRLVSVARPRRHSLHPSDLQLIFNMLFEAEGIKSGGGENWIPLCLPGFNKKGFLYMYVSFISGPEEDQDLSKSIEDMQNSQDAIAILLVSAEKESFYEMRRMRDAMTDELEKNGCMAAIRASVRRGRTPTSDIVPGTVIRHFLYKSKSNVQFVMPSFEPHFNTLLDRRRLMSQYQALQADVHAKNTQLKVQHSTHRDSISLAWITPAFELYCVAGQNAGRKALAQGVNKLVQWIKREEEKIFIIGGAVF